MVDLAQEIRDIKEFKATHSKEEYRKVMFRLFRYSLFYPLTLLFFIYVKQYTLAFIMFFVTIYGFVMLFYGQKVTKYIQERQINKLMNDYNKEKEDELQRANRYNKT